MREVGTIIDLYTEANREYLQLLLEGDHTKIMEKLTCLKELHKELVEAIGDRREALRIAQRCYTTALDERNYYLSEQAMKSTKGDI